MTRYFFKRVNCFVVLLLVVGCASNTTKKNNENQVITATIPLANPQSFGEAISFQPIHSIYELSTSQKKNFLKYFQSKQAQKYSANRRVYKYLERYVKKFNFMNKTFTARESLIQNKGNCLSLAILTTAFARLANVEIDYQLVDSPPIYQKEGDMILSSQHIRSLLLEPKQVLEKGFISFGRRGLLVDYFPTAGTKLRRKVSSVEFSAMFYRNKAAEAIIDKNYDRAYWLLKRTLGFLPKDEHSVNMMALIHQKKGLEQDAENLYKFGIKYADHKLELLRNYFIFLRKENRLTDAHKLKSVLNRTEVINPFDWVNLGHTAYSERKYADARRYFKKAIKLAPYLHQAHFGVAKSEFRMGNLRLSKHSLTLAKKHAFDYELKQLYQAKLAMLSNI
jgi:Tfp pilus assembly protein PilF/uncharacterized protein YcfL